MQELWGWVAFGIVVTIMMCIDLGVGSRRKQEMTMKSALAWSAVWISTALIFAVGVYFFRADKDDAGQFLAGYLIEEALSVDNLFVFVLIFNYFRVPSVHQRKVLYWGIIGAVIMRAIFIWAGIELINRFGWILYLFGAFLVYTGIKLLFNNDEDEIDPEKNLMVRMVKKFVPVTADYHDHHFFVRIAGKLHATPLFLVLVVVETTDLIFAVDSIPAVFGVATKNGQINHFVVYTSNVFAILGLRSLYFALAGLMDKFHYLKYGLSAILIFVGSKMIISHYTHWNPKPIYPLSVILGILAVCILWSIFRPPHPASLEHSEQNSPPTN